MSAPSHSGLSLVRVPKRRAIQEEDFLQPSLQGALFPASRPNLAVVVHFPDVTEEELKQVLGFSRPRLVIDLRSVPTFAMGRLNRRTVFDIFQRINAVYVEIAPRPGQEPQPDIEGRTIKLVLDRWRGQNGPVMFLAHRGESGADRLPSAIRSLAEESDVRWDVYEVPQFE